MIELHVERTDRPSQPPRIKKFSAATISVGRASACDLSLDDPSVSRRHCRLARAVDGWTIEDLGSANGTLLDGERIGEVLPVTSAETITVGVFVIKIVAVQTSEPPVAASRRVAAWPRGVRKVVVAVAAVAVAGVGGWTSAGVWDAPLRLPTPVLACPYDDPAVRELEAMLAGAAATSAEEATHEALAALARVPALPLACGLRPRAEAALTAALARMDHQRLGRHDAAVQALVAGDDGLVAAIDRDGRIRAWHRDRREPPLPVLEAMPDLRSLARSPDGRWLISGGDDGRLLAWDLHAVDRPVSAFTHGVRPVTAVQFVDAAHLWSVDDAGLLHTWTFADTPTRTGTTTTWPGVHSLTALRDGGVLAFGSGRAAVVPADLRRPVALTTGAALRTIAVADADIVAGDLAGKVTRWRLGRTLHAEPLTAHGGPVRAVAIRGDLVASIGEDDALRLVELDRRVRRRGPPLVLLAEVPVPVDRLVITGERLIGGGPAGSLVTWDLSQRTRRLPATVRDAHVGEVSALVATSAAAISGGDDGVLRVWPTHPTVDDAPLLTRACAALGQDAPGCED